MVDKGIIHPEFPETVKDNFGFGGEILLGHLRYGTSGVYSRPAVTLTCVSQIGLQRT